MKKILLTLLLLISFISGVNAEESTCEELLPGFPENYKLGQDGSSYYLWYTYKEKQIQAKSGETYTMFYNNADVDMSNYDFSLTGSIFYTRDTSNQYYHTYTFNNDTPSGIFTKTFSEIPENLVIHLVKGDKPCGITITPPEEPEPTIEPDTTLDNFYTIAINKLVELSNFTLENKFTLFALGIVIFFTIIGLFIHLFKGGRRQ